MKYCKDCQHYGGGEAYTANCVLTAQRNPVDGTIEYSSCYGNRGLAGRCGPDAVLFEPILEEQNNRTESPPNAARTAHSGQASNL